MSDDWVGWSLLILSMFQGKAMHYLQEIHCCSVGFVLLQQLQGVQLCRLGEQETLRNVLGDLLGGSCSASCICRRIRCRRRCLCGFLQSQHEEQK